MADPAGKLLVVKARLNAYVKDAIGGNVYNDWRITMAYVDKFPTSTIRLPQIALTNENYGRLTPDEGYWAKYDFTIFVNEERDDSYGSGIPDTYKTLDAVDDLMDYLIAIRGNSTEMSTYNIYWIDNILANKESMASTPRNISTYSVAGTLISKWEDE